jgi:hypothetical protein
MSESIDFNYLITEKHVFYNELWVGTGLNSFSFTDYVFY